MFDTAIFLNWSFLKGIVVLGENIHAFIIDKSSVVKRFYNPIVNISRPTLISSR